MNEREVLTLLIYCNELDGRHAPNEIKVAAWHDVFSNEAQGMTLSFAQDIARRHYSTLQDVMITPAGFVKAWRDHRKYQQAQRVEINNLERHCGKQYCVCTHGDPCYRGWIDYLGEDYTVPCGVCRADLRDALAKVPSRGRREQHHFEAIRTRHQP
jgi:hypothetical protein